MPRIVILRTVFKLLRHDATIWDLGMRLGPNRQHAGTEFKQACKMEVQEQHACRLKQHALPCCH